MMRKEERDGGKEKSSKIRIKDMAIIEELLLIRKKI